MQLVRLLLGSLAVLAVAHAHPGRAIPSNGRIQSAAPSKRGSLGARRRTVVVAAALPPPSVGMNRRPRAHGAHRYYGRPTTAAAFVGRGVPYWADNLMLVGVEAGYDGAGRTATPHPASYPFHPPVHPPTHPPTPAQVRGDLLRRPRLRQLFFGVAVAKGAAPEPARPRHLQTHVCYGAGQELRGSGSGVERGRGGAGSDLKPGG